MPASGTCWPPARPGCRWPSTSPPSSAWTPTTRGRRARSAGSGWPIDTTGRPPAAVRRASPWPRSPPSMTINATAAVLLLMYRLVAEEQGADPRELRGHGAERHPEGVLGAGHLHLPAAAVDAPRHRPHGLLRRRDARAGTPSRSAATTCGRRGPPPSRRWPSPWPTPSPTWRRLWRRACPWRPSPRACSFFWNAHSNLFEEAAKFRAARRLWARLLHERTGTEDPECLRMRFHAQTAASTLTAAQPEVNVVRATLQALAAVLGGTQSLHTNCLRRGPGPAHRGGGHPGSAHPAGAGLRVGGDRRRRPPGRQLRRSRPSPSRIEGRAPS